MAARNDVVTATQEYDLKDMLGRKIRAGARYRVISVPAKLVHEYCVEAESGERIALDEAVFEKVFGDDTPVVRGDPNYAVNVGALGQPVANIQSLPRTSDILAPSGEGHRAFGNEDFEHDVEFPTATQPASDDMMAPRRVVRVGVTPEVLAQIFAAPVGYGMVVSEQPIPDGAQFRGVTHDPHLGVLYMWFEHEKFALCAASDYPPELYVTFKSVRPSVSAWTNVPPGPDQAARIEDAVNHLMAQWAGLGVRPVRVGLEEQP